MVGNVAAIRKLAQLVIQLLAQRSTGRVLVFAPLAGYFGLLGASRLCKLLLTVAAFSLLAQLALKLAIQRRTSRVLAFTPLVGFFGQAGASWSPLTAADCSCH